MYGKTMKILRLKDVINRTGLSRATIYRQMKKGHFPNAIKISQRAIGWIESEIDEWIMQKVELVSPKQFNDQ